jgi:hypothetical protein
MQLHNNGSSKFTSGRSFSISSKISSLGGRIVTEVGDGIIFLLFQCPTTEHNISTTGKNDLTRLYRDVGTIKRQGHLYRPTIMC